MKVSESTGAIDVASRYLAPSTQGRERARSIGRDVAYGARALRAHPTFAVSAIVTLALGMCAAITTFGVVDSVLLRPLPFTASDQLVSIAERGVRARTSVGPSAAVLRAWQARSATLRDLTTYSTRPATATGIAQPQRFYLAQVTTHFFSVLGTRPAAGRTLIESDHRAGAPAVVVLSHDTWQHAFNGDPQVVGKVVTLDGLTAQVVGVMPASFVFPDPDISAWITLRAGAGYLLDQPDMHFDGAIGRLRPNASIARAQAELRSVEQQATPNASVVPHDEEGRDAEVTSLRDFVTGNARAPLMLLLAAGALVMLIACANVANLLLARATARQREIAMRRALGASRGRIIRQLLTESAVLATLSASVGLALAWLLVGVIKEVGASQLPRATEIGVHADAAVFTVGLVLGATALFGLAPALDAVRRHTSQSLRGGAYQTGTGRTRVHWRDVAAVTELMLTLMLLAGAGVLGKSVARLLGSPLGFSSAHVLVASVMRPLGEWPANKEPIRQFGHALLAELDAIPGVRSSAIALVPPGSHAIQGVVRTSGSAQHPGDSLVVDEQVVTTDYFRTLGIPLLRGRSFDSRDGPAGVPTVILDAAAAQTLFPGTDPVGQFLRAPGDDATGPPPEVSYLIVGVVGNIRAPGPAVGPVRPHVYIPFDRFPVPHMTVLVSSSGPPAAMAPGVRRVVTSLDPAQPVSAIGSLDDLLAQTAARPRFYLVFLATAAAIALIIAVVGVYAVIAFGVQQRTREIGVRTALGATQRDVLRLVLGRAVAVVSAGLACGLLGAWGATRFLTGLLVGVAPADPAVFACVAAMLAIASLMAALVPARRALRVSPVIALQTD